MFFWMPRQEGVFLAPLCLPSSSGPSLIGLFDESFACFHTGFGHSLLRSLTCLLKVKSRRTKSIYYCSTRNVSPISPSGPYPVIDSCGSIRSDGPIAKKLQLRKDELISSSQKTLHPSFPFVERLMKRDF